MLNGKHIYADHCLKMFEIHSPGCILFCCPFSRLMAQEPKKKFFERKDCDALTKPKEKKEKKDKEEKKEKDKGDNKRPAKNNDHDDAPPKKTKKVKKDK